MPLHKKNFIELIVFETFVWSGSHTCWTGTWSGPGSLSPKIPWTFSSSTFRRFNIVNFCWHCRRRGCRVNARSCQFWNSEKFSVGRIIRFFGFILRISDQAVDHLKVKQECVVDFDQLLGVAHSNAVQLFRQFFFFRIFFLFFQMQQDRFTTCFK